MSVDLLRWHMVASAAPVAATVYYLCVLIVAYPKLPVDVPVHFGSGGVADGWMNKDRWSLLSLLILCVLAVLAFTTRPSPVNTTTIVYWCVVGSVVGAFLQCIRAGVEQRNFHALPFLVWLFAVPACEFLLATSLAHWWKTAG